MGCKEEFKKSTISVINAQTFEVKAKGIIFEL